MKIQLILSFSFSTKLKFGSNLEPRRVSFPNEAEIVIVGGGAQGMAIAYKLAKQNYGKNIVVIDQVRSQIISLVNSFHKTFVFYLLGPFDFSNFCVFKYNRDKSEEARRGILLDL